MYPHFKYFSLFTATVVISLAFPLQWRERQLVTLSALAQTDYRAVETAATQTKPASAGYKTLDSRLVRAGGLGLYSHEFYSPGFGASLLKAETKSQVLPLNAEALKLSRQGRFQAALDTLEQALAISRELGNRPEEAATLNNLGRVYQNQGLYSPALKFYQQALAIHREIGNPLGEGRTFSNIAFVLERQNKPELAALFYKLCVNNREPVRPNFELMSKPQPDAYTLTVTETYRALGELLLKQNRVPEAQRILDLIKVQELDAFLQNVPGNQQTATGIDLMTPEQEIIQNINNNINRAVQLGKELATLRKTPPAQRSLQQKERIKALVGIQDKILEEFNNFITSPAVEARVEQLSQTAKQQNLNLNNLNAIRDNLARLPQKAVLLYPLILKDSVELVLVSPESPPIRRTVAVKQEELHQTIAAFRKALKNPSSDAEIPARKLYEWLIKPIENDLKQAKAQTIIYAPDDQLRYIPLTALYDGNQWLVQRFTVNHITAASLTDFNTPPQDELRVLAAAFTQGRYRFKVGNRDLVFSGLPFAGKEVETLVAAIPESTKLLDGEFTPNITVPQMEDHTIVHLATHAAFVVGKPEDSFILFGNGDRVTLRDVASWSLPNVDLVVLSACETGLGGNLGNGEEILGFGYQMQTTGARAAIASLWSVDDGGTEALMSAFYTALPSFTKAQALRQAQIALITGDYRALGQQQSTEVAQGISENLPTAVRSRLSHPYYWAPFILIGNGL